MLKLSAMLVYKSTNSLACLKRGCVLALAGGMLLTSAPAAQANEKILGFGQEMFFSFREATKKISPDFDIRIWASDLEKALVAYRKGKFKKAHHLFKASADDGDLMAHWWLGRMSKLGQGVPQNDGSAFYHFRQAALKFEGFDDPGPLMSAKLDSLVHVARYYRTGVPNTTIKRQTARALRIFRTAAQYGHPGAQYGIGAMYYDGDGMAKRPSRGMKWLKLSAQKHFPLALAKLGDIYWGKRSDGGNRVRALMWYTLAQNAVSAETHPDIITQFNEMSRAVPENELHDAHQRALRWSRRFPSPHRRVLQQPVGADETADASK